MALFSPRRDKSADAARGGDAPEETTPSEEATSSAGAAQSEGPAAEPDGPYDVSERPDLDGRLDLGSLRVRLVAGAQVGFATNAERTVVHGVTLRSENSALFLELFAAPRTFGIWDDVREEMTDTLRAQNATSDELDGPFGRELVARQVARRPDGSTERVPARILGIDGPRWFLRATASGEIAGLIGADRERHPLERALADVVVVRDAAARAPRSRIDLALPEGVSLTTAPQPTQQAPAPAPGRPAVPDADEVLRRGPEITETR